MSLNRCEDTLLAYLRAHRDEERFWHARVNACEKAAGSREACAAGLEREMRAYAVERGRADPSLQEALGGGTVRLRNLAEYLLATWTPPRAATTRRA